MNADLPHYIGGGTIHAGDRVRYLGSAATVAFVSDGDEGEFATGYADYHGHAAGIMLCDDDGQLTFLTEPTEDLEYVGKKTSVWD